MMTSLYSEPIPVTEITSDWRKFHFPRDSRVITCVNLNLDSSPRLKCQRLQEPEEAPDLPKVGPNVEQSDDFCFASTPDGAASAHCSLFKW
jgi:hypothetical protein